MIINCLKSVFILLLITIFLFACGSSSSSSSHPAVSHYTGNKTPIHISEYNVNEIIEDYVLGFIFNIDDAFPFFSPSIDSNQSNSPSKISSRFRDKFKDLLSNNFFSNNQENTSKSFVPNNDEYYEWEKKYWSFLDNIVGITVNTSGPDDRLSSVKITFEDSEIPNNLYYDDDSLLTNIKLNGYMNMSFSNYQNFGYDDEDYWEPLTSSDEINFTIIGNAKSNNNNILDDVNISQGDTLIFSKVGGLSEKVSSKDTSDGHIWSGSTTINFFTSIELNPIVGDSHKEEILIENFNLIWENRWTDNEYIARFGSSGNIYHSEKGKITFNTPTQFKIIWIPGPEKLTQGKMVFNNNLIIEVDGDNEIEVTLDGDEVSNHEITPAHLLYW